MATHWESQCLGRLIRSPGSPRRRHGSGTLEEEIGVWSSQGGEKDKHFFSLSLKLMLHNKTTQLKLCTKDYIITMYPAWGQFLLLENLLTNPVILKCILWQWSGKSFLLLSSNPIWKWKSLIPVATLCHPMDYTAPGILQARILEWVAFSLSRGSSQFRDQTQVSHIAGGFFTRWASREAQEY